MTMRPHQMTDETRVLDAMWPTGLPDDERAFLATLSPQQRQRTLQRLSAIAAAAGENADLAAIAEGLAMRRTAFYELRKRWAEKRSLKVVAPWATRTSGSRVTREIIARTEGNNEGSENGPAVDAGLSVPTMRRFAREKARSDAGRPSVLRAEFGRRFVLDVSGVNLIVINDRGPAWVMCAFLIERASGLILSARAGSADLSPPMAEVVRAGRAKAFELGLDAKEPSLDVVMPEPHAWEADGWFKERRRLADALGDDRVAFAGRRRFGHALAEAVGDRIGGLLLRPRAGPHVHGPTAKQLTRVPRPAAEEIDILLDVEVRRHNQSVEKRLRRLGLIGKGDPERLLQLLDRAYPPVDEPTP